MLKKKTKKILQWTRVLLLCHIKQPLLQKQPSVVKCIKRKLPQYKYMKTIVGSRKGHDQRNGLLYTYCGMSNKNKSKPSNAQAKN